MITMVKLSSWRGAIRRTSPRHARQTLTLVTVLVLFPALALAQGGSPFESEPASSRVEAPVNAALQDLKVVSIIRHGVVRRKLQGRVDLLVF
jgi:hypothetical protein